jgi:hypothetical protein
MEKAMAAVPKYTVKAKSRTPEENLRHQKFCAQQGGISPCCCQNYHQEG